MIKKIGIAIVVILSLTLVFFYGFRHYTFKNNSVKNETSVFNDIETKLKLSKDIGDVMDPEVLKFFENNPEGLSEFKYAWGVTKLDLETPWDYKTTPFLSEINDYDEEKKLLLLTVSGPKSMPNIGKYLITSVECTPDNTYIYLGKYDTTYHDKYELFEEVNARLGLLTYCLDESCSRIGRMCKLFGADRYDENATQ